MKRHPFITVVAIVTICVSCYMSGGKRTKPPSVPPAKPEAAQPAPVEKEEAVPSEERQAVREAPPKPSPTAPSVQEKPPEEKKPAPTALQTTKPVPQSVSPVEASKPKLVPARVFTGKLDDDPLVKIKGKEIKELSGMIAAQRQGEFWGHADNGNEAEIYRFTLNGRVTQAVSLTGVQNDDWEAITRAANGNLLIGGFGDNDREKKEYRIYECPEPRPGESAASKIRTYAFRYADGKSRNCEAFFVLDRKIYLIGKEEDEDDRPLLFCLDRLSEKEPNAARKVGSFAIKGIVTDAAYSPTHRILAVLTYSGIGFYAANEERDLLSSPVLFAKVDFDQCEGICFSGNDLLIANEKGEIWKYPLDFFVKR